MTSTDRMRSNIASTRSTAGTGFDFEDRVSAWLLLQMLSGAPLLGIEVRAERLRLQTKKLGYELDDLLVSGRDGEGQERSLAISCKANRQVSCNGLPKDFVQAAWRQKNSSDEAVASANVALASRGRVASFADPWSDIKTWVTAPADVALPRIQASGKHRVIFDNAVTAIQEILPEAAPEDAIQVLKCVDVIPFDFQHVPSKDESEAIAACAKLIAKDPIENANKLWQELLNCSEKHRLGDGSIDLLGLIEELRSKVDLLEHPNFAASWRQLSRLIADAQSHISGKLATGHVVERQKLISTIGDSIDRNAVAVVSGASGSGKSSTVKHTIEARFSDHRLVWLRADDFKSAVQEATRTQFGISQPLIEVLRSSTATKNVLVVDACERLDEYGISDLAKLLDGVVPVDVEPSKSAWKVVTIGQAPILEKLVPVARKFAPDSEPIDLAPLEPTEARDALLSEPRLSWMANDRDTLRALSNLKTLAWVIEGVAAFSQQGSESEPVSPPFVIDRLWSHWTGSRRTLSALLIKLAEGDASFETPPVESQIDTSRLEQLDTAPATLPVRFDDRRQLVFQHDLAADWARYQRLVELSDCPEQWGDLAGNPRWHEAFRLLTQRLLRQPTDDGFSKWDQVFAELENLDGDLSRVCDLLLDGLFLDPLAAQWLDQRARFLLEQNGRRLRRMLVRFHHVATRPSRLASAARDDIKLHLEASLRVPVVAHWPAFVGFLEEHVDAVARLHTVDVARICKTWLGSVPVKTSEGHPFPLRKELAKLALSMARSLQRAQETEQIFICDAESAIYESAFAAVHDLPDEVAQWALEMARRRPLPSDIVAERDAKVSARKEREKQGLDNDPEYQERMNAIQHSSLGFLEPKKLPPWPDGPNDSIEPRFRNVLLQNAKLVPLMIASPAAAAELLLAGMIEDNPVEARDDDWMLDLRLGLASDDSAYPPAYWKSPFYLFLKLNQSAAIDCLITIVNFCTDRWREAVGATDKTGVRIWNDEPQEVRIFAGNADVYDWTFKSTHQTTHLASALMALEQWLRDACDNGNDVDSAISELLAGSSSIAILGVLANVGKAHPKLFAGQLRPLLLNVDLIRIDTQASNSGARFFLGDWWRYGEAMWNSTQAWHHADFRKSTLRDISIDCSKKDEDFRAELIAALDLWRDATGKLDFQTEFWFAEIDPRNCVQDEVGDWKIEYPTELVSRAEADAAHVWADTQHMTLPQRCIGVLKSEGKLSIDDSEYLAGYIRADSPQDVDPETCTRAQVAAAATLVIKSGEWLSQQDELKMACTDLLSNVISGLDDAGQQLPLPTAMYHPHPQFFAITAITSLWIQNAEPEKWEALLVKVLTSYNPSVIGLATQIAYDERERLAERWDRIQEITLLWSALLALKPRFDAEQERRWRKWQDRLRGCRISGVKPKSARSLLALAERNERLMRRRAVQQLRDHGEGLEQLEPNHHFGWGLDDRVLEAASAWALKDEIGDDDVQSVRDRLIEIWAVERWRLTAKRDRDTRLPHKLGLDVIACLAKLLARRDSGNDREVWLPILSLGGDGEAVIQQFCSRFFQCFAAEGEVDAERLRCVWGNMMDFALSDEAFRGHDRWYREEQAIRHVMGFGFEVFMESMPQIEDVVLEQQEVFDAWATEYLDRGDDNIAAFARFLCNPIASRMRGRGFEQIARAVRSQGGLKVSDRRLGPQLLELVQTCIDGIDLTKPMYADLRKDALKLVDDLVAAATPGALALQDRFRRSER